jgi:hypothetical protein
MLKIFVALLLGAVIFLAAATLSGTVIQTQPIQYGTVSGPDKGAVRLAP